MIHGVVYSKLRFYLVGFLVVLDFYVFLSLTMKHVVGLLDRSYR